MCFDVGGVLISRLRGDSALYALPPTRRPKGKRGSPPRRGRRLPTPKAMAKSPRGWRTAYVTLHGKRVRRRIKSRVCLWWHVAKDHPIKVVIVKNPSGKGRDDYLFSTDVSMSDRRVIEHYASLRKHHRHRKTDSLRRKMPPPLLDQLLVRLPHRPDPPIQVIQPHRAHAVVPLPQRRIPVDLI